MYRWELDEPAEYEFAGLTRAARKALAECMDAVVIIDPAEYQRRPGEPAGGLRTLPFGPYSQGLVTFPIDVHARGDNHAGSRTQACGYEAE